MILRHALTIVALLLLTCAFATASEEILSFESASQESRYYQLIEELRCPKCLNQSIADSNAGISEDLRNIVYEMILEGKSDQEIRDFLSERYGDFILYKPETSGANLVLWFGPVLLMLVVLSIVFVKIRSRARRQENNEISDEELQRIQQILDADERKEGRS